MAIAAEQADGELDDADQFSKDIERICASVTNIKPPAQD